MQEAQVDELRTFSVDVIVPCYNASNCIEECIKSVNSGTIRPKNIFVFDDASDEQTKKALKKLKKENGNLRVLESNINIGAGAARNELLKYVTSDYIAFLDSDDIWSPRKLESQVRSIEEHSADIVTGRYSIVNAHGEIIGMRQPIKRINYITMHFTNWLPMSFTIIKASLIGAKSMPALRKRQDYAYWLNIFKKNKKLKVVSLNDCMGEYRRHKNGISANKVSNLTWNYKLFHEQMGYSVFASIAIVFINVIVRMLRK